MQTGTDSKYYENFQNDIHTVWSRTLCSEFYHLNKLYVIKHLGFYSGLECPIFNISDTKSNWGTWQKSSRVITISLSLLREYPWSAVSKVLRHEMAHMIVDEILDKDGAWKDRPHGELFKRACDVMEIDSNRCHSETDLRTWEEPEKEKILNKIYKLFALGESPSENESKAAIAKAYELMTKHNISRLDLNVDKRFFVSRPVGRIWRKVPSYIKTLSHILKQYYLVEIIYMHSQHNRGKYLEIYGEPHNVDIAEYVYHYLILEGERLWGEFQNTDKYKDSKSERIYGGCIQYSKIAFIDGLYHGFSRQLSTQKEETKQKLDPDNKLPIWIGDPILAKSYKQKYNPRMLHCSKGYSSGGYAAGIEQGLNIRIRQGVSRTASRDLSLTA